MIDGAANNTVGGTASGAGNTFAFNGSDATHGALTVNVGTGNEILTNLFYGNTPAPRRSLSGINLTNGGNDGLPAPVITSVTASGSGSTNITLNVSGMAAGTYLLDVFASAGRQPPAGQVDARVPLGTVSVTVKAGDKTETVTLAKALSGGQQVTATWTVVAAAPSGLTAGDTSEFSATAAVPQPFVVTTTDGSVLTPGSLAFEINAVNSDSRTPMPTRSSSSSRPPPNDERHLDDHAEQRPHDHSPGDPRRDDAGRVHRDAGDRNQRQPGDRTGLTLAAGSANSTIRGLDIVDSPGAGLDIESSTNTVQFNDFGVMPDGKTAAANAQGILVEGTSTGNTIGGTAGGAGNVVAFNSGIGIDVTAPSTAVNTIRGNLIYSNTGTAFSTNRAVAAPSLSSATSNGGTTTVQDGSGPAGATFDFYATSGTLGPAAIYLGSSTSFPASLPVSVPTGASSWPRPPRAAIRRRFSGSQQATNPFAVTNTADQRHGSLEQAIINVNDDTGNSKPDTITFDIGNGGAAKITLTRGVLTAADPSGDHRRDQPAGIRRHAADHDRRRRRLGLHPDPGHQLAGSTSSSMVRGLASPASPAPPSRSIATTTSCRPTRSRSPPARRQGSWSRARAIRSAALRPPPGTRSSTPTAARRWTRSQVPTPRFRAT